MPNPKTLPLRTAVIEYLATHDLMDVATFGEHKPFEPKQKKDGTMSQPSEKDANLEFATISIPLPFEDGIIIGGRRFYPSSGQVQVNAFHLSPTPYLPKSPKAEGATISQDRLARLLSKAEAVAAVDEHDGAEIETL